MHSSSNSFSFSAQSKEKIQQIIARYPEGRQKSAVMPLLYLAQEQNSGHLNFGAISEIANILGLAEIRVYEVASFYTMYNMKPIGKYHVQVCGTTPCMLAGAEDIMNVCESFLGIKCGQTDKDGLFTLTEVECLGACSNAPMVQVNNSYYEDLSVKSVTEILQSLKNGKEVKVGSQTGRKSAEPFYLLDKTS